MLKKRRHRRLALAVALLLAAALLLARHVTGPGPPPPEELPTYAARQAGEHLGEYARVCGRVVDAAYVPGTAGRPTFLNFGEPHPDAVFTALVWGEDRPRFDAAPERAYRGRRICVHGRIRDHEGRPEIIVRRPSRIGPSPPPPRPPDR